MLAALVAIETGVAVVGPFLGGNSRGSRHLGEIIYMLLFRIACEPFTRQSGLLMTLKRKPFENSVWKQKYAGNQHFLIFLQCFLPILKRMFVSKLFLGGGCVQMLSIWTSLKICHLGQKSGKYACFSIIFKYHISTLSKTNSSTPALSTLYYTIPIFNDLRKRGLLKTLWNKRAMMALNCSPESVSPQNDFYLLYYYCFNL